jgi:hypothetical protein
LPTLILKIFLNKSARYNFFIKISQNKLYFIQIYLNIRERTLIYGDKGCKSWLFVQNRPKIKKFRVILPTLILKIF